MLPQSKWMFMLNISKLKEIFFKPGNGNGCNEIKKENFLLRLKWRILLCFTMFVALKHSYE